MTQYIITVSSRERLQKPHVVYDDGVFSPEPYPLVFRNGSPLLSFTHHDLAKQVKPGDLIGLFGVVSKHTILKNVVSIKKDSRYNRIHHANHGLIETVGEKVPVDFVENLPSIYARDTSIPDMEQHYIMSQPQYTITITGYPRLHGTHDIFLIYTRHGDGFKVDHHSYLVANTEVATENYTDNDNRIGITFDSLYGISCKILNSYHRVSHIKGDVISIDVGTPAIVDTAIPFYDYNIFLAEQNIDIATINNLHRGGGANVHAKKIKEIKMGYPHAASFSLPVSLSDIISATVVSTTIPYIRKNVPDTFAFISWLDNTHHLQRVNLPPGNYTNDELATTIMSLIPDCKVSYITASNLFTLEMLRPIRLLAEGLMILLGWQPDKTHSNKISFITKHLDLEQPPSANIWIRELSDQPITTIYWDGTYGKYIFDKFTPHRMFYETPITRKVITVEVRHPDGSLVDFDGYDFSFSILLTKK